MSTTIKARVFMSGRSQHVTIPAEFRFTSSEVYIRRDSRTGELILSQRSGNLEELFEAFDRIEIPESFLSSKERDQAPPVEREEI